MQWGSAAILAIISVGFVATGCRQGSDTPSPAKNTETSPAPPAQRSKPRSAREHEKPRHPAQPKGSAARRLPSPAAECGHAIAFAGFSTTAEGDGSGSLLYCDPGDNVLAGMGHRWEVRPSASPVICGTRRPTVVLAAAGAFTVMGAAVISPLPPAESPGAIQPPDPWMPDLSQNIDGKQNALCGPTSAADVFYAIAGRRPQVLAGYQRGPALESDEDVRRLLLGAQPGKPVACLAACMQMTEDTKGTTPKALVEGMESWLHDADPGGWTSTLQWLDDSVRAEQEQLRFFQTLAATQRRGGGAVLLLWPGSEFADGSVADAEATEAQTSRRPPNGASAEGSERNAADGPDSTRPNVDAARHASPDPRANAGGRGFSGAAASPEEIAKAAKSARAALEAAKSAVNKGRWEQASEALKNAMEAAAPYASQSEQCLQILDEANELAERLNQSRPRTTDHRGSERMTEFD